MKIETWEYQGKKIVGNPNSINTLKNIIENIQLSSGGAEETKEPSSLSITAKPFVPQEKPRTTKETMCQVCTYVNQPDTTECIVCNSRLSQSDIENIYAEGTEIVETIDNLPEGTEISDIRNIEDILNDIQKTEDTDLSLEGIEEASKKIFKCLGVLN